MRNIYALLIALAPLALQAQNYQLSPTFGTNGGVRVNVAPGGDVANAHVVQPDGKLLVSGYGYDIGTNSFHVSLLRVDTVCGAPDLNFGNGGSIAHVHEQRTTCHNMVLQPDGRIVGCGMIAPSNAGSQQWPGVYRFLPDGPVDGTFNGTGYHRLSFNGGSGDFTACFINPDSSITCTGAGFLTGIGAVRFNPDGTLDTGFGTGGTAVLPLPNFSNSSKGTGIMRPDSSVVSIVITWSGVGNDYVLALAQFNAFGAPDTSFGTGGLAISPVLVNTATTEGGVGASLLPDGRILVSCMATDATGGFLMARFLTDGTMDSTYATNGVSVVTRVAASAGQAHELLADGSTLQFGSTGIIGTILKRDADGQVVTGFGTNGFVDAVTGAGNEHFIGGFTLPSGRIIGYGDAGEQLLAIRLTTDPVADALPAISLNGTDLTTPGTGTFEWFLDGTLIGGATGNTLAPLQNGVYTVTMTISPDCIFTSAPFNLLSVGLIVLTPTAVQVLNNPALGMLMVVNSGSPARYEVVDLSGRKITQGLLMNGRNDVDLGNASGGVYLLRTAIADVFDTQRIVVY